MRALSALALLALAACATTSNPSSRWLVGNWCPEDPPTTYAGVSDVGLWPTRFNADGTYETFEDSGRWTLRANQLTRRAPILGSFIRRRDRVERLGPDRMAWTWGFGERELWHRCSPDER
jgi:hypothetical protein